MMEHLEVHTGDKPFLCQQCDSSITTQESGMKVQVIVDTGAKLVQCDMCGKKFTRASNLTGHIVVHKTEKPYKCDKCEDSFEMPALLKTHIDTKHGDRVECDVCHKTFSTQGNLCKHKRLHETSKPFPCRICKKSYATRAYLKSHMWEHVEDKPFECEICKKKFSMMLHLKRHMINHSDVKPHNCDICGKQFPTAGNLKRHRQTHILYECQVCGKRCQKLVDLKEHLTDHLEEKAFPCEMCDRRFKTEVLLNAHQWVHTRDKNPHFCTICKMKFPKSKDLKDHKVKVHGHSDKSSRRKVMKHQPPVEPEPEVELPEDVDEDDEFKVPFSNEPEEIKYVPYEPNKRHPCDVCNKSFKTAKSRAQHAKLHSGKKQFTCDVCGGIFRSQTNLRRHLKLHTRAHPFECTMCDKSYKTVGALKTHMWEHNDIKPFQCGVCHKKFSQEAHVKRHMIVHSEDKKFKCDLCDMTFSQSGNYKRHKATHSIKYKSKCPVCERMFRTSAEMMEHLEQHNGSKLHQCSICHRKYATEPLLKAHMWVHAEKKFYCKRCSKRFASRLLLRRHMTFHAQKEKDSAHQCEICKKRFLKLGNYRAHVAHHGLSSELQCPFCDISFTNNRYMDRHMKDNHPDSKIFKCTFCEESFLTTYLQMKHVKTQHLEESRALYSCDKCEGKFSSRDALTAHQVEHGVEKPFSCSSCPESFVTRIRLQLHNRIHRGAFSCSMCSRVFMSAQARRNHIQTAKDPTHRPFNCKICKKMFSSKQRLTRHSLIHTGERPFSCTICDKRFTQASHLKDHMRLHTGEKPFQCPMCDRKFTHSRTYRCHQEVCFGKSYDCPCGCGENNKPHKAFQCQHCEKRFRYHKYLKMHLKTKPCSDMVCPCGCLGDEEKHKELEDPNSAKLMLKKIMEGNTEEDKVVAEAMEVEEAQTVSSVPNMNMENTMKLVETILEAAENSAVEDARRSSRGIFPCHFCKKVFDKVESRDTHVKYVHEQGETGEVIIKQEPVDEDEMPSSSVQHVDNSCQTDYAKPDHKIETNPKYRIVYETAKKTTPKMSNSPLKGDPTSSTVQPEAIEATSSVEQLIEAASLSETFCSAENEVPIQEEQILTLSDGQAYRTLSLTEEQVEEGQVMSFVSGDDYVADSQAVTVVTDGESGMSETLVLDSIPADAVRIIATRPDNDTDTIIIKIEYDDTA